jgi:transposase
LKRVRRRHPDKRVELWFQDEARFGQKGTLARRGTRPRAFKQTEYQWVYLFGSVCPATGRTHGCLLPRADTEAMDLYLADFARQLAPGTHALLVLDGAGWHMTGRLTVPAAITLLALPPYSPELNPPELLWRELRQKYLSNRVFPTVDALDDAVAEAWLALTAAQDAIRDLTAFPYIQAALN